MKKVLRVINLIGFIFVMSVISVMAATVTDAQIKESVWICRENPVYLAVNNQNVNFSSKEVPPLIIKDTGTTLIPARAAFEAMGGVVDWNNDNQSVTVRLKETTVVLTINSDKAFVNGIEKTMSLPALIVDHDGDYYGSTMIPLRFTAEALGLEVKWDNDARKIYVFSQTVSGENLQPAAEIEKPFIADIRNIKNIPNTTEAVVIDEGAKYNIMQFNIADSTSSGTVWQGEALCEGAKGKLVVLDIGHGGKDKGAIGHKDLPDSLYEKDINMKCGLKLNEYLRAAGVTTLLIRDSDVYYTLPQRAQIANDCGASLFVSCHNNSNDNKNPHGTEVHYANKVDFAGRTEGELYGLQSKAVAKEVQKEMISELGTYNRGIKESPALAVIRRTNMPAIIIEGAFLSNEEDLAYMQKEEFAERYALGAAKGIIKALNDAYK